MNRLICRQRYDRSKETTVFHHMSTTASFSSGMPMYGSAGDVKLLVLSVTFFLLEIDSNVTCFLLKTQYFRKFLKKVLGRLKPSSYPRCTVPELGWAIFINDLFVQQLLRHLEVESPDIEEFWIT